MKAKSSPAKARVPAMPKGNDEGGRLADRNLLGTNPKTQQFEPTPTEPVRQRFKMAGGC